MFKKMLVVSLFLVLAITVGVAAYDIQGGTVTAESTLNMRSGPSVSDASIFQLASGTRVAVLDKSGEWYKVAFEGKTGFVSAEYLETQEIMNVEPGGAKVTTEVLNLREKPSTDASILKKLSNGTITNIIGINSGWFKVRTNDGTTGYISPDFVAITDNTVVTYSTTSAKATVKAAAKAVPSDVSGTRKDILEFAATLLGIKYKYGSASPSKGFDCSGFTQYVFAQFDISLSRSSSGQYSNSVTKISKSELQPGDLVFFSNGKKGVVGHVGIYVGNDEFIHAPSPGGVVEYESMSTGYYKTRYIGSGTVF